MGCSGASTFRGRHGSCSCGGVGPQRPVRRASRCLSRCGSRLPRPGSAEGHAASASRVARVLRQIVSCAVLCVDGRHVDLDSLADTELVRRAEVPTEAVESTLEDGHVPRGEYHLPPRAAYQKVVWTWVDRLGSIPAFGRVGPAACHAQPSADRRRPATPRRQMFLVISPHTAAGSRFGLGSSRWLVEPGRSRAHSSSG